MSQFASANGRMHQGSGEADSLRSVQGDRAKALASQYVWWQPPQQTLAKPSLLVAQIMNLGVLEGVQWLLGRVSRDALRGILRGPLVGIFNGRS